MKVSVVIPSYNCGAYLDDAMKSVLQQTYTDFELIVVNDGSTDHTEQIVKDHLHDRRVRYIKKSERGGLSAARNTGIDNSNGDLIALLDADDMFLKDKIEKQVQVFLRDRRCDVCYTNEVYFKDGSPDKEMISTRHHFSGDIFFYLKRSNFIHISTVMARGKLVKNARFDETLKAMGHGDWEFVLRLSCQERRFAYLNEVLSRIRIRDDSMTLTKGMIDSRNEVGLRAKLYWDDFKKNMRPFTLNGQKAIIRYMKMKGKALLIGFPDRKCFNRPVPQELL